jgi:beta-lactamase class D
MKKSTIMTGLILLLSMLVGIVAAVSARQQEPKVIPLDVTAVKVDEFSPARKEHSF